MVPTPEELLANANAFVQQMLTTTSRLVRLDESNKPSGISSGFIVEKDGSWNLLAAYHSLKRGRYCLETNVTHEGEPLVLTFDSYAYYKRFELNVNGLDSNGEEVDFGWMKIDRDKLSRELRNDPRFQGKQLDLPFYCGPLNQRPNTTDLYGYAAWNRGTIHEASRTFLEREPSYEIGLKFLGFDEQHRLYRFQVDGRHKGDKYYSGASGAPIADSSGLIVSMLVGGSKKENLLWGLPLADVEHLIGVEPSAPERESATE